MGIDFDPEAVKHAEDSGIPALYGDVTDPEFTLHLHLDGVKTVVFAFHHHMTGPLLLDLRRTLARGLRDHGFKGHIAAPSHPHGAAAQADRDLALQGVDIVLEPFHDAALEGAERIVRTMNEAPA